MIELVSFCFAISVLNICIGFIYFEKNNFKEIISSLVIKWFSINKYIRISFYSVLGCLAVFLILYLLYCYILINQIKNCFPGYI